VPDPPHPTRAAPTLLITAGPTHEPIDAVRYLANRSSGRLGLALADAAAERGCPTTLLLGPACEPADTRSRSGNHAGAATADPGQPPDSLRTVRRFRTAADLEALLMEEAPRCDALIMAAAVADYRPARPRPGKLPRTDQALAIALEPVPDLLAMATGLLRPGAVAVGFALEEDPLDHGRALAKMARKGCQAIVLNPLATMDSGAIDATILFADGRPPIAPGPVSKADFARRLVGVTLLLHPTTRGTP
jgi:phosphopantothenoylcysteine decarboxylase/phosphopantothenate--cysteine ligase